MQNTAWSNFLATYNIADHLKAEAYEASTAQERACLKNAIAYHALEGEGPSCEHAKLCYATKGYKQSIQKKPAPWALYICDEHYSSPARFIAALMPAINAQVEQIYIIFTCENVAQSLLTCLELLGIEECLAIPKQDATKVALELLQDLASERGRVLILSSNGQELTELHQSLHTSHIPMWQDLSPPHIHATAQADMTLLQFAEPDAINHHELKPSVQAIYGYTEGMGLELSPFITQAWAKGMEACFLHENLSKEFFKNTTHTGASLEPEVL